MNEAATAAAPTILVMDWSEVLELDAREQAAEAQEAELLAMRDALLA